jgi:hypothetical protein
MKIIRIRNRPSVGRPWFSSAARLSAGPAASKGYRNFAGAAPAS